MRRLAGSRLGATLALSVVLSLGAAAGLPASVQASTPPTPANVSSPVDAELGTVGVARARAAAAEVELPRPVRGANAVRALGDQLDEAAALNDLSEAGLTELLTTDRTAWLDLDGVAFFKDEVATAPANDPVSAAAPLDQTFQLHSKPGSTRTIYLDFDGAAASATAWHVAFPATPTTQPAWDLTGSPAVFDDVERTAIQTVWQAVAEDYAPFDVDVTTADPGPAGTTRASTADSAFGSHVLITPSNAAHDAICAPTGCGGVAYLSVFDAVAGPGGDGYGYRQPAWVFPQKLGNSPKNIAEAVSHEVGHNFGLDHDGTATLGYYTGHGSWAPIMGSGYTRAISQWSRGDYDLADNQEDDVAIIRGVTGSRADEAPTSIAGAATVPAGTAYVTGRTDVDTYLLGTCTGPVTVTANTLGAFANLDIELSILDATGQVVATADLASAQTNVSTAVGLGAMLVRTLTPGTYYASVDGVGNGAWSSGYDDYGSLGAYTLAATGCDGVAPATPAPTTTALVATASGRTVTLTATPATGTGTLAGSVVFRDSADVVGTVPLGGASAVLLLTSVGPGSHDYTASFVPSGTTHAGSTSPTRSLTVQVTSTTALTAATSGRDVTLAVQVTTDGGSPAGVVELRDGSTVVGSRTLVAGAGSLTLSDVAPGTHSYLATFLPADTSSYAGSSSPVQSVVIDAGGTTPPTVVTTPPPDTPAPPTATQPTPVAPALSSSTTTVEAPRRARAGTRPVITVTVTRASAAANGTVVVTVGKKSKTLTLRAGSARLRLARVKKGRLRIRVRYLGNATTTASTATRTIKVAG